MPQEIELKYLVRDWDLARVTEHKPRIDHLTQWYLSEVDGTERRIRSIEHHGEPTRFYYTEKTPTSDSAVREELEREISQDEFDALLDEKNPGCNPVSKLRYTFTYHGQTFELDVYLNQLESLVILEVEVADRQDLDGLVLPTIGLLINVTADKRYSNRRLAQDGIPA